MPKPRRLICSAAITGKRIENDALAARAVAYRIGNLPAWPSTISRVGATITANLLGVRLFRIATVPLTTGIGYCAATIEDIGRSYCTKDGVTAPYQIFKYYDGPGVRHHTFHGRMSRSGELTWWQNENLTTLLVRFRRVIFFAVRVTAE
jgi:hypothetical protein